MVILMKKNKTRKWIYHTVITANFRASERWINKQCHEGWQPIAVYLNGLFCFERIPEREAEQYTDWFFSRHRTDKLEIVNFHDLEISMRDMVPMADASVVSYSGERGYKPVSASCNGRIWHFGGDKFPKHPVAASGKYFSAGTERTDPALQFPAVGYVRISQRSKRNGDAVYADDKCFAFCNAPVHCAISLHMLFELDTDE